MSAHEQADEFRRTFVELKSEIQRRIVGHDQVIEQTLICLFTGGHALVEGVPGLGKTLLVKTLSQCLDLSFTRIQFTPDLMPADIIGTNVVDETPQGKQFRFQRGPLFGQVVLADEINRATPKTQSALLEAMQEVAVTVGGTPHPLQIPFFVLATQNPIEMDG
ncbi:MAG: AAA family ATPase, partial [Gammaproteobacteria bacterium]